MVKLVYRSKISTMEAVAATIAAYEFNQKVMDTSGAESTVTCFNYPKGGSIILPNDITLTLYSIREIASRSLGLVVDWITEDTPNIKITDEHRADAVEAKRIIDNSIIAMTLTGDDISPFLQKIVRLLDTDTVDFGDFGILSYVAKVAKSVLDAEDAKEKAIGFFDTSKSLGKKGSKIKANITIMGRKYLAQYENYFYNAHDDNGNLIIFFKQDGTFNIDDEIKISARVKTSGPDSRNCNAIVTQVNYVMVRK